MAIVKIAGWNLGGIGMGILGWSIEYFLLLALSLTIRTVYGQPVRYIMSGTALFGVSCFLVSLIIYIINVLVEPDGLFIRLNIFQIYTAAVSPLPLQQVIGWYPVIYGAAAAVFILLLQCILFLKILRRE